jgi:hypothetical protein
VPVSERAWTRGIKQFENSRLRHEAETAFVPSYVKSLSVDWYRFHYAPVNSLSRKAWNPVAEGRHVRRDDFRHMKAAAASWPEKV